MDQVVVDTACRVGRVGGASAAEVVSGGSVDQALVSESVPEGALGEIGRGTPVPVVRSHRCCSLDTVIDHIAVAVDVTVVRVVVGGMVGMVLGPESQQLDPWRDRNL